MKSHPEAERRRILTSPGRDSPGHWSLTLRSSSRRGLDSGPQHTTMCSPSAVKPRITLLGTDGGANGHENWTREGGVGGGSARVVFVHDEEPLSLKHKRTKRNAKFSKLWEMGTELVAGGNATVGRHLHRQVSKVGGKI